MLIDRSRIEENEHAAYTKNLGLGLVVIILKL